MYESFYNLSGKPFSLLPDAEFLFMSSRHRRAVSLLEYGIMSHAGFIVISGDVGAGKTTIIQRYLMNPSPDVTLGVISNSDMPAGQLLGWIANAFKLNASGLDEVKIFDAFADFLSAQYAKGKRTVLIIDEAQNLKADTLEKLRMLSNINYGKYQLLQIVLAGQPELLETLRRPDLRQFVQRIAVHCHLDPLTPAETAAYIRHRLYVVGGAPALFNDVACAAVHYFTGGVPRLINMLCDQALVYGYAADQPYIRFQTVAEVVFDRARGGMNLFRDLPKDNLVNAMMDEMRTILHQIKAAPENRRDA